MALGTAPTRRQDDGQGDGRAQRTERLGGARADFAANLGRRAAEIGTLLDALTIDGRAARPRDDLRRRVHALAAGAKLLRFRRLGTVLRAAEERLDAAAKRGDVAGDDLTALRQLVSTMADLAWGGGSDDDRALVSLDAAAVKMDAAGLRAHVEGTVADVRAAAPYTALVVGSDALAKTLSMPDVDEGEGEPSYEIERTYDAPSAIDLARALAPDVVVVDAELPAARELVEALSQDPLCESVPVVVVGRFYKPEDAGPFLALGIAKALPKPVSPGALRQACKVALSAYGKRESRRDPLGQLRVDQLGARLAEELRRGLCDAAESKGRGVPIELGDGTEVLAALWGAVARIRDVVTIRSGGAVRFAAGGPEGALPIAPWLGPDGDCGGARERTAARGGADASLEKCSILVADDDPSVTWYLAGVFKAAGATVFEARDGERALEIAKHRTPDLVVSDVLMPRLDGFALCRALKRDVALRDVPVVLLSWKEDLLQRVRELGADADGYLRKEASAGVIVQRVRELMRQRRRVRERIAAGGEVKGRLDGMSAATLLRFACELRPSSTLALRDATFLYEIEIRRGRPIRASRISIDGHLQRGSTVLASLLGAGDGRFVITPVIEAVGATPRAELEGDLAEQLLPLIAGARAAQRLVSGEELVHVDRVGLEEERLAAYLAATPEPSRTLLRSFARGTSPRTLLIEGRVAPQLLESVLCDAAAHGAIFEVIDARGEDMLPAALCRELSLLRGERMMAPIPELLLPEPAEPSAMPPLATPLPALVAAALSAAASQPRASAPPPPPSVRAAAPAPARAPAPPRAPALVEVEVDVDEEPDAAPSPSGPRALLPEIPPAPAVPSNLGPLLPAAGVASPSPAATAAWPQLAPSPSPAPSQHRSIPASPPIPVFREAAPAPAPPRRDAFGPTSPLPARASAAPSQVIPPGLKPMLTLGSLTPPPVHPAPASAAPAVAKPRNTKSPKPAPVVSKSISESPDPPSYDRRRMPLPSAFGTPAPAPAPRKHTALWVACAIAGIVFAVWARASRQKIEEPTPVDPVAATAPPSSQEAAAAPADDAAADAEHKAEGASSEESGVEDLPLRKGDQLKKGQGLLEVVAGKSDSIYIDGKAMGSGPTVSVPLRAKDEPYELKVKQRGEERVRKIVVREGRMARVRLAPPWQR